MKNKKMMIGTLIGVVLIICVIVTLIIKNDKIEKISNPLTEVESVEEMEKYLGYKVPVLNKNIKSYIIIDTDNDNYADHARIIYEDESYFEMENVANKDVSGIYTEEEITVESYNDVNVTKSSLEGNEFIAWTIDNYSYSYSVVGEIYDDTINELIKLTK